MSTTYLFPSTLQGLADVSVSPGAGQNNYPLIWSNTLGKWVISLLPSSAITGLGTLSTQNATAISVTGGSITGLTSLSVVREGAAASARVDCYSSTQYFHSPQFIGYRARNTVAFPQGLNNGDWIFYFGGAGRGATGWAVNPTGFTITAKANSADYPSSNNIPTGYLFQCVNASSAVVNLLDIDASALRVLPTTAATSTTTGALRVSGGLGCVGAAYIGGGLVASNSKVNFANLPTDPTPLSVGDLWRDGEVVKVKL